MATKNRTRLFADLDGLRGKMDEVQSSTLEMVIRSHGEQIGNLEVQEALYRFAVEIAYYRKKKQLGYVQ